MQLNNSGITDLANTEFSTATVELRIGTNYIDWQADGSILLRNKVHLGGTGIRAMDDTRYLTDAWRNLDTVQVYETSGTFTVPSGVYEVWALLTGGGGGGGGSYTYTYYANERAVYTYYAGGAGGYGGVGFKKFDVTPGSAFTFTIGAGGTGGAYYGHGVAGGNSTLTYSTTTITATGGGAGLRGSTGGSGASGANGTCDSDYPFTSTYSLSSLINNSPSSASYPLQLSFIQSENLDYTYINTGQTSYKNLNNRTALAYTYSGTYKMGSPGQGGDANASLQLGDGGIAGGVMFFYKAA